MTTVANMILALVAVALALPDAQLQAAELESPVGRTIEAFSLQDSRGKNWQLSDFADAKLVVVAFLGTECPLAKLYGPRLQQLANQYQAQGVAFLAINANRQDSLTELAAYARDHKIEYPLLKDPGNRVADQFAARRTPEVFLLDAARTIRYHGRIDDQYGIGYVRDEPQRHDLKTAIDELLAGKVVSQPETAAPGCYIGRVRQPQTDAAVTYSNQISRLLQKRCAECHRPGDIGPFSLLKYDEVAGWAETIAEVVREERMPPWHAAPEHGQFAGDRRLSAEEKSLIAQWVKAGAPEGDPSDLPAPLTFAVEDWQLPRAPDQIVAMADKPYVVPSQGTVSYQFFTADPDFKEDKWLSAVEVRPGNRAVVHHVLVFVTQGLTRIDEGGSRGFLAAYVPGLRAAVYPEGMARKVPAGSKLMFQVHYTPNGSPQLDLTEMGLIFADAKQVQYEIRNTSAVQRAIEIPPHADNYEAQASTPSSPGGLLLAMMPHMHLRGKSFRYEAVLPDGTRETLLDVPHYDFNWQTRYILQTPRQLPPGTRVHCVAHFDNSEQNLSNPDPTKKVRWGQQTWEEMMIGYLDIAVPLTATREGQVAVGQSRVMLKQFVERMDVNADGLLERDEVPELLRGRFDAITQGKAKVPVEQVIKYLQRTQPQGK